MSIMFDVGWLMVVMFDIPFPFNLSFVYIYIPWCIMITVITTEFTYQFTNCDQKTMFIENTTVFSIYITSSVIIDNFQ